VYVDSDSDGDDPDESISHVGPYEVSFPASQRSPETPENELVP
jgi:hypothetical protein